MSFVHLDCCEGPACPTCGCQDARIIREPRADQAWFGSGLARCRHCGRRFNFRQVQSAPPMAPEPPLMDGDDHIGDANKKVAVDHVPEVTKKIEAVPEAVPSGKRRIACEDCDVRMKVTSTREAYRWYKCPNCGKTEKIPR